MISEEPRVYALWELFRARWLGRYFQECGLKVVPNVSWRDGDNDFLEKYVLKTLPKNIPLIAMQLQTIDEEEMVGGLDTYISSIQLVFDTLQPKGALIYASKSGRKLLEKRINVGKTKVKVLTTRMEKLSVVAKARTKKTTI